MGGMHQLQERPQANDFGMRGAIAGPMEIHYPEEYRPIPFRERALGFMVKKAQAIDLIIE